MIGRRCRGNFPAAPPESVAESVRIGNLRRCVEQQALPPGFVNTCPPLPSQNHRQTTIGERDRALREVARCPFYFRNPHTGGICPNPQDLVHATDRNTDGGGVTPLLETTQPGRIHQYRTHPRIRGIDEITRLVRSPTAGEVTARRRVAIETAAAAAVRHGEHFRAEIPRPPCRLPVTGPQPGVPLAPVTPCNPGTQRVDYSNPRA
jgi:hypothetical protein